MEIPERYLILAEQRKAEELADDLLSGDGETEALWEEIHRMLKSKDIRDMDAIEDMSLKDIIMVVAETIAGKMANRGDLDEEAFDIAVGDSYRFQMDMNR